MIKMLFAELRKTEKRKFYLVTKFGKPMTSTSKNVETTNTYARLYKY